MRNTCSKSLGSRGVFSKTNEMKTACYNVQVSRNGAEPEPRWLSRYIITVRIAYFVAYTRLTSQMTVVVETSQGKPLLSSIIPPLFSRFSLCLSISPFLSLSLSHFHVLLVSKVEVCDFSKLYSSFYIDQITAPPIWHKHCTSLCAWNFLSCLTFCWSASSLEKQVDSVKEHFFIIIIIINICFTRMTR